jgi:hypothetical protein
MRRGVEHQPAPRRAQERQREVLSAADLARRLRELIAALDRRTPRIDSPVEPAIARDAAFLREQAVARLAEIAARTPAVPLDARSRGPRRTRTPKPTPFPAAPEDVAALSVQEFTFDPDELDGPRIPAIDGICRTFVDDANRALVWLIRFGALRTWFARPEVRARATSDARILRDAREVAASFPLNARWEFDSADFGRAVDGIAFRRARADVARKRR